MELAAPGIKKEYCRVSINDEGNLTIAIEKGETLRPSESGGGYQAEHKHEDKHHHYPKGFVLNWTSCIPKLKLGISLHTISSNVIVDYSNIHLLIERRYSSSMMKNE